MTEPLDTLTRIVAIDGPAGAGKSTVSRAVARALGFAFLDTGAMYRAATWWAMRQGVDLADSEALTASTAAMDLELIPEDGKLRVRVGDHDVTDAIRTSTVTNNIRNLDGIQGVRDHLVRLQREFAAKQPTVAEGRDMGTVVFPKARCKIYLDASLDTRAKRRADELAEKGETPAWETLRDEIHARDENDRNRKVAPLQVAEDAYMLDTTGMTVDDVIAAIVGRARAVL